MIFSDRTIMTSFIFHHSKSRRIDLKRYLSKNPAFFIFEQSENFCKLQIENKSNFDSVFLESKIAQEYNRGWKKYIKKECVMMIISVIFAVAYFLLVALVAALFFRAIGKIFELFDGFLMYH